MINILCLDKWSKGELFKEYAGKSKVARITHYSDPDKALKFIKENSPEIIVLGGDIEDDYMASVRLAYMLIENDLHRGKYIYISTWNPNEAKVVRNVLPKAFYIPFCESLVNTVMARAYLINSKKKAKSAIS